jgi:hypothetical protein
MQPATLSEWYGMSHRLQIAITSIYVANDWWVEFDNGQLSIIRYTISAHSDNLSCMLNVFIKLISRDLWEVFPFHVSTHSPLTLCKPTEARKDDGTACCIRKQ